MRRRWIVAGSLAALAVGAAGWAFRSRPRPAREFEVDSNGALTEKIRAGLEGTRSRCELEPPSAEDQADWKRLQEQRRFARLSMADLLREGDTELNIEVASRLLDELYSTGLGAMTETERNVTLVNELQGEVFNGGFHQYFANSSGNCASRVLAASRAIDPELSKIVERALAQFPNSNPSEDRATRNEQMASLANEWDAWSDLDDEFYKLPLDERVTRYIRANSAQFNSPAQAALPR
jgi:hypothetical protein